MKMRDDDRITTLDDWQAYEWRKKELPVMPPGDYEEAIRDICDALDV